MGSLGSKAVLWILDISLVLLPKLAFRPFADHVGSIFLFDHSVAFFVSFKIFLNFRMIAEMVVLGIDSILATLLTLVPEL